MKFSIITPSFNQGCFMPDCVESVLLQTGHEAISKEGCHAGAGDEDEERAGCPRSLEIEHIVVDAGSTDETLDVLGRYPHLKWTSGPDQGMSDGINKGFRQAAGDWVMWLNCDDYLLPGTLTRVAECARKHPHAAVIHGDCVFVNGDKSPIRRKYDTPVDEWDFLFVGCCIPSTATFYRSDIIRSGHLLDVTYRNCMDWEYFLRLTRLGYKFQYLPEALAGFRWHEESTTQKHYQRMIEEGLRAQREHVDACGLPRILENAAALKMLRKIFQARRVLKRLAAHGRIW